LKYKVGDKISKDPDMPLQLKAVEKHISEPLFGLVWGSGFGGSDAAKCILDEYESDTTASAFSSPGSSAASDKSSSTSSNRSEDLLRTAFSDLEDNLAFIDVTVGDVTSLEGLVLEDLKKRSER